MGSGIVVCDPYPDVGLFTVEKSDSVDGFIDGGWDKICYWG